MGETGASCHRGFIAVTVRVWVKRIITQMYAFIAVVLYAFQTSSSKLCLYKLSYKAGDKGVICILTAENVT